MQGAMGFAVLAGTFALQPETWPVFAAWARAQGVIAEFDHATAAELLADLVIGARTVAAMSKAGLLGDGPR
jgi:hypothetical protein